ncbi:MAG: hypothetical protein FWC62_08760, partial [Firmicutes bacterium]|nr:hypothetical protein [Bacillota bacterium]
MRCAKELGFDRVYLTTDHVNLYEKYGFVKIDEGLAYYGDVESIYTQSLESLAPQFTDVCLITNDVLSLRAFYEAVFGGKAEGNEIHSALTAGGVMFVFDYVAPL